MRSYRVIGKPIGSSWAAVVRDHGQSESKGRWGLGVTPPLSWPVTSFEVIHCYRRFLQAFVRGWAFTRRFDLYICTYIYTFWGNFPFYRRRKPNIEMPVLTVWRWKWQIDAIPSVRKICDLSITLTSPRCAKMFDVIFTAWQWEFFLFMKPHFISFFTFKLCSFLYYRMPLHFGFKALFRSSAISISNILSLVGLLRFEFVYRQ